MARYEAIMVCSLLVLHMLTHFLLSGAIPIVVLAAQELQPIFQIENIVIEIVAWASFDQQDFLVRQVLGQSAGDHTTGSSTTHDDVVKDIGFGRGKGVSRHFGQAVARDGQSMIKVALSGRQKWLRSLSRLSQPETECRGSLVQVELCSTDRRNE